MKALEIEVEDFCERYPSESVRVIHEDVLPVMEIVWVDEAIHSLAMTASLAARWRELRLVDRVSFVAMRQRAARVVVAFAGHIAEVGLRVVRI